MVATNSVAQRTSNISAGTSFFSMVVLEKPLKDLHTEIDMVTTPDGSLVAMVHSNNGTTDLNAWVNLFKEFADSIGADVDMNQMYGTLYNKALEGDADCGGILSYGNYAGEPITNVEKGRPMVVRTPETKFNLANFMRSHLYTALGVIKVGMDILTKDEGVEIDTVLGHGGLFKTKGVGQKILADAINTPVVVMETAGEGGPWGMAILAEYMVKREEGEKLEDYLKNKVFGSDNNFYRLEIDYRQYKTVGRRKVIAWTVQSKNAFGDVPLTKYVLSGTPFDLRGYYMGQFRDKSSHVMMAEYRQMINTDKSTWIKKMLSHIGYVAWGGCGFMGPTPGKIEGVLPNLGLGLRIEVQPRMNVRLDFGRDMVNKQNLFYFNMTEAF